MKFRKGDIVSMQGAIKYDADDKERVFVRVDGSTEELWVKQEILTLVQPHFEVGDQASWRIGEGFQYGTVIGLANDHAWIDLGGGDYCTRTLSSIGRVEVADDIA